MYVSNENRHSKCQYHFARTLFRATKTAGMSAVLFFHFLFILSQKNAADGQHWAHILLPILFFDSLKNAVGGRVVNQEPTVQERKKERWSSTRECLAT